MWNPKNVSHGILIQRVKILTSNFVLATNPIVAKMIPEDPMWNYWAISSLNVQKSPMEFKIGKYTLEPGKDPWGSTGPNPFLVLLKITLFLSQIRFHGQDRRIY